MDKIYEGQINFKFTLHSKKKLARVKLSLAKFTRHISNLAINYGFIPTYNYKVNEITDTVDEDKKQKEYKINEIVDIDLVMRDNSYFELLLLVLDINYLIRRFEKDMPIEVIERLSQIRENCIEFNNNKFKL